MKLLNVEYLSGIDNDKLICTIPKNQTIPEIVEGKEYEVKIERKKRKRSLNANSYMWVLLQQLAVVLNTSKEELYLNYIRTYGDFDIIQIKDDAVDKFIMGWESNGLGYIADKERASKNEGYSVVRCYYGSSSFDTRQMSRLIDQVVEDCKENHIETLTEEEVERLKGEW